MRARKKAEEFWLMLGQTAHDQGVDALELFEPVLDLSFMLSQCGSPVYRSSYPATSQMPLLAISAILVSSRAISALST